MVVKSIHNIDYANYFRSRWGGSVKIRGVSKHSENPTVLAKLIVEIQADGWKPLKIISDNAGEFISDKALAVLRMYDIYTFQTNCTSCTTIRWFMGEMCR